MDINLKIINVVIKQRENILDINLIIIGNGELKNEYLTEINYLNLENRIQLIDYQKNVSIYLSKSLGMISSPLWEDPGCVMIEAAACNTFIISSDCLNGPREFVGSDNGILLILHLK